jgi:hypothetical protein
MSTPSRLGIVHLGDLAVGYPWSKPHLPELLETLGWPLDEAAPSERRLDPPPTLAVVLSFGGESLVARHQTWLRRAKQLVLVHDLAGQHELLGDPESLRLLDQEHAVLEASLGGNVRSVNWTGTPESSAELVALLQDLAEKPVIRRAVSRGMFTRHPEPTMMAPGPWRRWEVAGLGGLGAIARLLCTYLDRPAILDLRSSPPALIDLVDGARLRTGTTLDAPATISPDGRRVLGRGPAGLEYGPFDGDRRPVESPREIPILIDPMLGLGAVGTRCWFSWVRVTADDASVISAAMHDWPCGHEKKLYGYLDNDPVRIEVSDDGDAFVSIYDVDAIIGSLTVPRWRPAGPALVPDWPPRDPARVLFTCPDWRWAAGKEGTVEALHGDCRGDAPVLALGPDRGHRYTLGLEREVWRLRGDEGQRIGGPDDGYAVFDADHVEVRRAKGRLLCGSGPWLWVEDDGHVWREQVRSGTREYRIPLEGPKINAALPVPASGHAVLVRVLPTPGKTIPPEEPVRRVPWLHEHFELRLV